MMFDVHPEALAALAVLAGLVVWGVVSFVRGARGGSK